MPWVVALVWAWLCSVLTWYATIGLVRLCGWTTIRGERFVTDRWHMLFYFSIPILGFALGMGSCWRYRHTIQRWLIPFQPGLDIVLGLLNCVLFIGGITLYPILIVFGTPFDELQMTTHLPPVTIVMSQRFTDLDTGYARTLQIVHADGSTVTHVIGWSIPYCPQFAATERGTRIYLRCENEPMTDHTIFIDLATHTLSTGGATPTVLDLQQLPHE